MSEIELVLKSPTDRIAPFSVKCNSVWTIKQLKNHIKEVYPCKPSIESQKVIYVGKLLKDDQIIKDIFEPNSSTIVHFICQSSLNEQEKENEKTKEKMEMTPELYEEYQAYINSYYSSTSQSFSAMNQYQQMMWINQAYMQTYANYYAQFQKNSENVPPSAPKTEVVQQVVPPEAPVPNQENAPNNDQQIDGQAGRENGMQNMMAAAFGGLMGDGGEDDNGGELEPRDILHYFYVLVRFGLLLLICYYYSSVVSVITTLMLFFLFFGVNILRRNNNQRQQQDQQQPAPVPLARDNEVPASVPAISSDVNAPSVAVPDVNGVADNVASGSPPEAVTQPDIAPTITERLRRVASTSLQFVLTFFVTLFPEPIAHIDIN